MNRKSYIVIHKTEWDRIRRQENTDNISNERENYFRELIEKSQEMINNWSDSVQGHINKVEKQKKLKLAKDIKTIKDFNARKKLKNNDEVIKKAKDLMFQDSCYGRQLMSALLGSKVLEEREAQIKFQNEIRKKIQIQELEPEATSLTIANDYELDEKQIKYNKKHIEMEIAKINKGIYEKKHKDEKEKRKKELHQEKEDVCFMNEMLQNETKLHTEMLVREKKEIKEYAQENNKLKERQADVEKNEELLREVWRKYQDRIKCKEKAVFDKIHRDSSLTNRLASTYKVIEQLKYEKEKKYHDFIETGVSNYVKRLEEQSQRENKNKENEREKRIALDKENKMLLDFKKQIDLSNDNHCLNNQQFPIIKKKPKLKAERIAYPGSLDRNNKLLEKKFDIAKPSWSGLNGAHAQFAQHASHVLQQCRYKHMALKVIDDYRKINYVDEKSLPVSE